MSTEPKKSRKKEKFDGSFADWPARVQSAFEAYYAIPKSERSVERLVATGLHGKAGTLRAYSFVYNWGDEIAKRDRAAADEARESTRKTRAAIIDNFETGIGNLASAYANAMSGICPKCRNSPNLKANCTRCGGTGEFDPLRVNSVAVARLRLLLDQQWGDSRSAAQAEEVRGSLSHAEYLELQRKMLEEAGADAAEDMPDFEVDE